MNTVLFCREDSIYKKLGCDTWTKQRNFKNYTGNEPIIAHPPCRGWGKFKWRSNHETHERGYAIWALQYINKYGGILEHPKSSDIWNHKEVREDCKFPIQQSDYGHKARKDTILYIVGVSRRHLPRPGLNLGNPDGKIEYLSKSLREHTPIDLARYLIKILEVIKNAN